MAGMQGLSMGVDWARETAKGIYVIDACGWGKGRGGISIGKDIRAGTKGGLN